MSAGSGQPLAPSAQGQATLAKGDGVERIYEFRCRCGRVGMRRGTTRLVKVNCRDCGASVEWWRSRPVIAFAAPETSIELSAAQIEDIRADRWRDNTARAVALELGPADAPHPAVAAPASPKPPTCPMCHNANTRLLKSGSRQCLDCEAIWDPSGFAPAPEGEHEHEQLDLAGLPAKRRGGI